MFVRRLNNQSEPLSPAAGWDDLRAHNTALLLRAIWSEEGLSRADLARRSGLSRATVSDIVARFVELGVVVEAEVAPSAGGRPPIRLEFQDGWRHLLGIELGAAQAGLGVFLADVSEVHRPSLTPPRSFPGRGRS